MNKFLIEGGSVVDPLNKKIERRDLLIADGKFQRFRQKNTRTEIISAKDKYIIPGLFDLRCHLSQPGVSFQKSVEKIGKKQHLADLLHFLPCQNYHQKQIIRKP